jgi:hypothetical protein
VTEATVTARLRGPVSSPAVDTLTLVVDTAARLVPAAVTRVSVPRTAAQAGLLDPPFIQPSRLDASARD